MNLTDFSTQMSDHIFRFMHFRHFSSQLHVLSFSECLNAMPGVLVAGSERRDDKNKEIYMTVKGDLCKLRNLSRHPVQISTEFDKAGNRKAFHNIVNKRQKTLRKGHEQEYIIIEKAAPPPSNSYYEVQQLKIIHEFSSFNKQKQQCVRVDDK